LWGHMGHLEEVLLFKHFSDRRYVI